MSIPRFIDSAPIVTHVATDEYRAGWDAIFGEKTLCPDCGSQGHKERAKCDVCGRVLRSDE